MLRQHELIIHAAGYSSCRSMNMEKFNLHFMLPQHEYGKIQPAFNAAAA